MALSRRNILAIMAGTGWCYRAQSSTNAEGASKHANNGVMAAELFYSRGSEATPSFWISGEPPIMLVHRCLTTLWNVLEPLLMLIRRCLTTLWNRCLATLWNVLEPLIMLGHRCLTTLWNHFHYLLKLVLHSTFSPLELGACIAVVDVSEAKNCFQIALAVTTLFLAVCDWHVPRVISYHNDICRFLSAMCMQALFPYSPTLTCLVRCRSWSACLITILSARVKK